MTDSGDDGGVLIRRFRSSDEWTEPETTAYTNENDLQALLAAAPGRVPGVADEAVTTRELSTSAGPIDVCIVAPDGSITAVECKLASNSERRRMVIGQVIDYASAIWRDGSDAFFRAWQRAGGPDLAETLTPGALDQLKGDISDARINLCLAVDRIDSELRRLVEYLNRVTQDGISVTALQLAYARDGDVEILIPTTYGGEIAAVKKRRAERGAAWTRESFTAALGSAADRNLAGRLFELIDGVSDRRGTHELVWFGSSPRGGVFFHPYCLRYAPFQLWVDKAGQLMLYGNWGQWQTLQGHSGFEELAQFLHQDYQVQRRGVAVSSLDLSKFWSVALRCAIAINEPVPSPEA